MDPKRAIPSMFHRRLLLLWWLCLAVVFALIVRVFWLTVARGEEHRRVAEAQLDRTTYLPTFRGRILDRNGRILAADRPSYDVAVKYSVITGSWALEKAERHARGEHESEWPSLGPDERMKLVEQELPRYETRVAKLWTLIRGLGGIDQVELTARLDAIKAEVQALAGSVWTAQEAREIRDRIRFGKEIDETWRFRPRPLREHKQSHVVLPRVPDQVAFEFRRFAGEFGDMFELQDSRMREYPWSSAVIRLDRSTLPRMLRGRDPVMIEIAGTADHILGGMRQEVWRADLERRPFERPGREIDLGGYRIGDEVGAQGLERSFEDHLRGERGRVDERRDTGAVDRQEPSPGTDLTLTLDIELQQQIQALLSPRYGLTVIQQWQAGWESATGAPRPTALPLGTPLNAAAVVLEVETGDILAMVSSPSRADGERMSPIQQQIDQPWYNRPVEAQYPPGSIIKPLVLAAAVSEGAHTLARRIECTGHFFPHLRDAARCWIYRPPNFATHSVGSQADGPLDAVQAIARSCNIYFYTLADRLGMERLSTWYRSFGMGTALDIGLSYEIDAAEGRRLTVGEVAGAVPDEAVIARLREAGELEFATVILGIGQGPVAWTPMHAANAYATLARGGLIRDATILGDDPRGTRPRRCEDLPIRRPVVEAALEGLRQSVMEPYGTGHHIRYADGSTEPIINATGVTVWAKTGTAQAPPLRRDDTNHDGVVDANDDGVTGLDHAWFVGLVGPEGGEPLYAITVLVEYGGSGGRTAGPVANQIIRSMQRLGYLPSGPDPSSRVHAGGTP